MTLFEELTKELSDIVNEVEMDDFRCHGTQTEYNRSLSMDYFILKITPDNVKTIGKTVIENFQAWVDSLPEAASSDLQARKTPLSRMIVNNYVTGYLHDLEEEI